MSARKIETNAAILKVTSSVIDINENDVVWACLELTEP